MTFSLTGDYLAGDSCFFTSSFYRLIFSELFDYAFFEVDFLSDLEETWDNYFWLEEVFKFLTGELFWISTSGTTYFTST